MTDDIHEALLADAERWRAQVTPGPSPRMLLGRPRSSSPSPRAWAAITAACIVVVVVATAAVLIKSRETQAPATASGPCELQFAHATSSYQPTATRPQVLTVTMKYTGQDPCNISAYGPLVELRSSTGHRIATIDHSTLEARKPGYLELGAGDRVSIQVEWVVPCTSGLAAIKSLTLHMSGNPVARGDTGVGVPVAPDYQPQCDVHVAPLHIVGFVQAPDLTRH